MPTGPVIEPPLHAIIAVVFSRPGRHVLNAQGKGGLVLLLAILVLLQSGVLSWMVP